MFGALVLRHVFYCSNVCAMASISERALKNNRVSSNSIWMVAWNSIVILENIFQVLFINLNIFAFLLKITHWQLILNIYTKRNTIRTFFNNNSQYTQPMDLSDIVVIRASELSRTCGLSREEVPLTFGLPSFI